MKLTSLGFEKKRAFIAIVLLFCALVTFGKDWFFLGFLFAAFAVLSK